MDNMVYERLAEALDSLPNGFPRTPSRVEIRILQKIFTPDEARLAGQLGGAVEPAGALAARAGLPVEETGARLGQLAGRGLLWGDMRDGEPWYRLAPFVVGIYEAQLDRMDHEFAHLFEQYWLEGGAAGIMSFHPAVHRVIPAQRAVKTEWILPYDDVRAILQSAKSFGVRDCICRVQQDYVGRKCDFPLRMCVGFASVEWPPGPHRISLEEALKVLDQAEDIGLVHTVSNVEIGVGYVCNCCGCCCGVLRGITELGIANSVAHANYYAVIDPAECAGCGTCVERCQVHAITEQAGVSVVDRERCIGCGLCVTGCPNHVAMLQRKPDAEIVTPPANFAVWEQERRSARGI